jgi:hypothetical protein
MDLYPTVENFAGTSGAVAPAEGNYAAAGSANPVSTLLGLGPNNELLDDAKPELVNALRELVRQYRAEGVTARRHEIRRIRQARLFWQGQQNTAGGISMT